MPNLNSFVRRVCLLGGFFAVLLPARSEVFLRANQVGYKPEEVKMAMAFSDAALPKDCDLVDTTTGKVARSVKVKTIEGKWGKFEHHAELDFSSFNRPGNYVLRIGAVKSAPFVINQQALAVLPDQLLEFMRQQRCGYNPWLDAVCHPYDGRTAYGPLTNGTFLDCSGGWHDAGDLLKYLITSANATAQLLLSYEMAEAQGPNRGFADRCNALGQEGSNGVADVLDEAKWGLDWMLKLHPAPDQLYHQIADDRDHKGWRLPQNENVDYGWGVGKERVVYCADGKPQGLKQYQSEATGVANLAGRYAATMALAYQVWKDDARMKPFAERCLIAAREVYALGRAKEGYQQGNSYGAPYRYEETTWADDMEWGAAEMYLATGEKHFLSEGKHYAELAANDTWMPFEQTKHYQFYPFQNAGHYRLWVALGEAGGDRKSRERLAAYYREGIEQCVARGGKNPYRIGVPFIWCSNNLTVALATQCLLYERMTGDKRFEEFAAEQRDWLLGRNPWGTSMFTDIGTVSPKDPHLMANKILHRSIRGGLVDGPVYERIFKSLKGVGIEGTDPLAAFQDELAVYHDDIRDYSSNEPTMDGTASAILLWALYANVK